MMDWFLLLCMTVFGVSLGTPFAVAWLVWKRGETVKPTLIEKP